MKLNQKNIKN